MSENSYNNLSISEIESERTAIISYFEEVYSKRERLIKLSDYFNKIVRSQNSNILNSFLPEFIEQYISLLSNYDPFYLAPSNSVKILDAARKLIEIKADFINFTLIDEQIKRIDQKFEKLLNYLNGDIQNNQREFKFPVLESDINAGQFSFGFLESISIQIRKAISETKFLVIPSESHLEEKIDKQIRDSWSNAINYLINNKVKVLHKHHEVLIAFDRKVGIIIGNSLGVVLTIAFIEELLKFHNSKMIVDAKENISLTGGVDENGRIISTSREIIRIKTEIVFYSAIKTLCVSKVNELAAEERLSELKKEYPNRNLEIVGLTSISDLLNRRNIVEIKRQKLSVRAGKFIRKNWVSAVATVLLAVLFSYLFVMDFDDNPVLLQADGSNLFVKNKNGKVLWTKHVNLGGDEFSNFELLSTARIIDIDGDRVNEVLLTQKFDDKTLTLKDYSSVYCYDKKGKIIWFYEFKDNVISNREELKPDYTVKIVDTLTLYSKENILLISNNMTSYSSAIFRINLRTGKRLPGTVWTAGHILGGEIKDIDKDGKKEFMGTGYDNGYEDVVFWGVEIDSLLKMRPTREDYLLRNMSIAEMKVYIRFPKIDYDYFKQIRTPTLISANFSDNQSQREYRFSVGENTQVQVPNLSYKINYNFKDIDVIITSGFRVRRDSLVSQGKLNLPFTDTDAYKKIIMDNILYWKDGKWVDRYSKVKK